MNCGEVGKDEDWGLVENDGTVDVFPNWPEDWDYVQHTDEEKIDVCTLSFK